jgi:hypothetical protein
MSNRCSCRSFAASSGRRPDDATTITAEHIEALARVDDALTNFYRDPDCRSREAAHLSERKLREWFGEHLITSAKTRAWCTRENGHRGTPQRCGGGPARKYILRADIRPTAPGTNWRDRLVEPILADNRDWEALYRNPVKEALKRDPDKLLTGSGLVVALQYRKENPQELDQGSRNF